MKNFLRKNWLGIIFLILIAGVLIAGQFYDIVLIPKKGKVPSPSESITESKTKTTEEIGPKINLEDLKVDLENLSEQDLASVKAYLKFKKIKDQVLPSGVPETYGKELDISFDKVQEAINRVAPFGLTYGKNKIELNSQEMKRYIAIGSLTACKYCCGAKTLVFENGQAACGCAHSQMMRGLAAYLIKNHPQMTDEEILQELNTWRVSFFPKQSLTEKLAQMEKAGEPGIKEILEEFPDFLPQMVGGC